MAVFGPTGACGAALYMGTCSGHGTGTGSSHHPGWVEEYLVGVHTPH